jgi:putative glutamine amidotransferase
MVARAGGVPVVIPPTADPVEVLKFIDGWLISGGSDIDARRWGEENHPESRLQDLSRFELESALFRLADLELPVLGICYGCQLLNVVRGGALHQHLPEVLGREGHTGGVLERYDVDPKSLLSDVVEAGQIDGKSYHHQAVSRLGTGLKAVAKHADGTIEAIEATDRPWMIGVQWHPERTPEDEATRRLFEGFVGAAAAFRRKRAAAVAP